MNQVILRNPTIDTLISAWLHAKLQRSKSERTEYEYRTTILSFRYFLQHNGMDLLSNERDVGLAIQAWCGQGVTKELGAGSTNTRLAVLSSFYRYAIRQGECEYNPVLRVERRVVEDYAHAQALSRETVRTALSNIRTDNLEGLRDKTILMLALTTGKRLSEIANMRREHLTWESGGCLVVFPRTKGGKTARKLLTRGVASLLYDYLSGLDTYLPDHEPSAVWVSLSPNGRGYPLSGRSIERICKKHLGTGRFHALRHTFAHEMENAGAKMSEIQSELQHSNIATTGKYLARLSSDKNPYAEVLASLFQE